MTEYHFINFHAIASGTTASMWEDDLGMLRRQELAGRDQSVDLFHLDATQLVHVHGGEKADRGMEKGMMLGNGNAVSKASRNISRCIL